VGTTANAASAGKWTTPSATVAAAWYGWNWWKHRAENGIKF
jgi:hypothetical protein